jgi:hypothetical protein
VPKILVIHGAGMNMRGKIPLDATSGGRMRIRASSGSTVQMSPRSVAGARAADCGEAHIEARANCAMNDRAFVWFEPSQRYAGQLTSAV